jgi:hypothetical protein
MKAWIQAVDENFVDGVLDGLCALDSVASEFDATRLSDGDAQAVARKASDEYPTHTWHPVKTEDGSYIVEGIEKPQE